MTSMMCTLREEVNQALKAYAREHGNVSKSKAATQLIGQWLREKGYMDPLLSDEGYENLEDAAA